MTWRDELSRLDRLIMPVTFVPAMWSDNKSNSSICEQPHFLTRELKAKKSLKSSEPQMWDIENTMPLTETYRHGKEEQLYEDANGTNQLLLLLFQLPKSFCAKQLISQCSRIISITDNRACDVDFTSAQNLSPKTPNQKLWTSANLILRDNSFCTQPMWNLYYLTSNHCETYNLTSPLTCSLFWGQYCDTFLLGMWDCLFADPEWNGPHSKA